MFGGYISIAGDFDIGPVRESSLFFDKTAAHFSSKRDMEIQILRCMFEMIRMLCSFNLVNETIRLGRVKNSGGYFCQEESLERIRSSVRPAVSEKNYPLLT